MTSDIAVDVEFEGPVEGLYADYLGLILDLDGRSPSGLTALNRSYHKHLLVAAASSLEEVVKDLIPRLFETRGGKQMGAFVSKRVMARNYSQLFDWKAQTAQGFFASFGDDCSKNFKTLLKTDDGLKKQHDAFLALGHLRNEVVHNDYAIYPVALTPDEIIEQYRLAIRFTERFEDLIFNTPVVTSHT